MLRVIISMSIELNLRPYLSPSDMANLKFNSEKLKQCTLAMENVIFSKRLNETANANQNRIVEWEFEINL